MTPYQDADPVTETTRGQQSTSPAISQRTKVSSSSFRGRQPNKETFLLIKSKTFFFFSLLMVVVLVILFRASFWVFV
jgi:hypothetical protein